MNRAPNMAGLVREYLEYRRQFGFRLDNAGQLLMRFAEYADRSGHRGPVTTELAVRWARLPRAGSAVYRARRLDLVRGFARYRAVFDPRTEIPPRGLLGPAYRRVTPHIYTEAEVSALLDAARQLAPADGLRPHTYATLFGLLACTGLRLSEALHLDRSDVDWRRGLLTVRQTKFRKSRLVPLHPSTTRALRDYADRRDRSRPVPRTDAFFVTVRGSRVGHSTAEGVFLQLRKRLAWAPASGDRAPRIHDLRHAFACRRLLLWYAQGVDIDRAVPALATYLGHAGARDTYWYLTAVPELLERAAARFEHMGSPDPGDRP
jgi:integrase